MLNQKFSLNYFEQFDKLLKTPFFIRFEIIPAIYFLVGYIPATITF